MDKKRCYGCMKEKTQQVCEFCGFDENTQNAPHQLAAGTMLQGRYLVGKVLGQGGFGITYLGWDGFLDVPVAIKEYFPSGLVMRENGMTVTSIEGEYSALFAGNRERFLREAKTLAKFANVPQVVHVLNLFMDNNTAYIVMEYVDGITMKDYIRSRGGRITAQETFSILRPVMEALSKVHEAGIVHRDISPDNIMMLPNGSAKLLDFGAVREVENADVEKALTKSTEAILKHGFAPIEQYQTRGGLGPWTDVYALCATIYYCLTGKVPADAPLRVMGESEVDWDAVPGVTDAQAAVLEKGMNLAPKGRIRSVKELYEKLFDEALPVEEQKEIHTERSEMGNAAGSSAYPSGTVPLGGSAYPSGTVPLVSQSEELHTAPISRPGPEPEMVTTPVAHPGPKEEPVTVPVSQPERKEPEKKRNMGLIAAAAVVVLAVIIGIFAFGGKEETPKPQIQQPTEKVTEAVTETTTEPTQPASEETTEPTQPASEEIVATGTWRDNVLMYSEINLNNVSAVSALNAHKALGDQSVFGSGITRKEILTVTFLDTLENAPDTSWDVSENQDGSVLAWTNANGDYYDLYIAGEGGVNGKNSCRNLFSGYLRVQSIQFNGNFHTDEATDMTSMFNYCWSLKEVDASSLKTSNVTNMDNMFYCCSDLSGLDLSNFNTSNVTRMAHMFAYCKSLTSLDISNFNTANVESMAYMFYCCKQLTELNVSNFDTSKVQSMGDMFYGCAFSDVDLSSFCTSSVTIMSGMFEETPNLKDIDLSNFDFSNVTNYSSFMDSGDTVNGRPWEELFQ